MFRRLLVSTALILPLAALPAQAKEARAQNLTKEVQQEQQAAAPQDNAGASRDNGIGNNIAMPPGDDGTARLGPGEIRNQKGIEPAPAPLATPSPREETASLPADGDAAMTEMERYKQRAETAIRAWDDRIQNPPDGVTQDTFKTLNDAWADAQQQWALLAAAREDEATVKEWESIRKSFEASLNTLKERWNEAQSG